MISGTWRACACAALAGLAACAGPRLRRDYRGDMRRLVTGLSSYAKTRRPGFVVLTHNALPLLTADGTPKGRPVERYLKALDGVVQESLFYSHDRGPTPPEDTRLLGSFLDLAKSRGLAALVIDYPSSDEQATDSDRRSRAQGYLCFEGQRDLDRIPQERPPQAHKGDVRRLQEAADFLYLINPGRFADRSGYLDALRKAGQDVMVVDLFYGGMALSAAEVASLQRRPDGRRRLVLAYMSVGEAEDYRYYWKPGFSAAPPGWLEAKNPTWPGDYKVRYWDPAWRRLVYGGVDSYLDRILAAGFDGVALDVVDAYAYFEAKGPRPRE
jgi:cysteinyl-tRNA synthetase